MSIRGIFFIRLCLCVTLLPTVSSLNHCSYVSQFLFSHNESYKNVQQSVRDFIGHEAAEIGLGWNSGGGGKLMENDSKCLEGGRF